MPIRTKPVPPADQEAATRNASFKCALAACLLGIGAQPALADAEVADYRRANGLDVAYRDMGVMIHHTRYPFKTSANRFVADLSADRNWSRPQILPGLTRAANSVGELVRGRATGPIDVAMTVLRPRGASGSTCVISYRGTDREHKFDPSLKDRILVKEDKIPQGLAASTFSGRGGSCVVKDGYRKNYLETRAQVYDFLDDATRAGQCARGILILGMSLGGATASVAFTDLVKVRSMPVNQRVQALINAKKVWLVTAGAPRATSEHCAADVERRAGHRVKRFIYGSLKDEMDHRRPASCARFVDPVPGNPYVMRQGTRMLNAQHFGKPIVGHNTFVGENPNTPSMRRAVRMTCNALTRCKSKRFANRMSRVSTRTALFEFPSEKAYPRVMKDSGGACSAPGLIPGREYMFGRMHDTCSYRNLMAVYGQKYAGEPKVTNHACRLPRDTDDPNGHPFPICPLSPSVSGIGSQACPGNRIHATQLHQR